MTEAHRTDVEIKLAELTRRVDEMGSMLIGTMMQLSTLSQGRWGVAEEKPPLPGVVKPLRGDGQVVSWAMSGPSPYDGVWFVCTPDDTKNLGIRCMAEAKVLGEIVRYQVVLIPEEIREDVERCVSEKGAERARGQRRAKHPSG